MSLERTKADRLKDSLTDLKKDAEFKQKECNELGKVLDLANLTKRKTYTGLMKSHNNIFKTKFQSLKNSDLYLLKKNRRRDREERLDKKTDSLFK